MIALIDDVNQTAGIDRDALHLMKYFEAPESRSQTVAELSGSGSFRANDLHRLGLFAEVVDLETGVVGISGYQPSVECKGDRVRLIELIEAAAPGAADAAQRLEPPLVRSQ